MPLQLKNYTDTIPGGFTYLHPVTGIEIGPHHSLSDLHTAVIEHEAAARLLNTIVETTHRFQVEDQICRKHPEHCLNMPEAAQTLPVRMETERSVPLNVRSAAAPSSPVQRPSGPPSLDFRSVLKATKILGKWVLNGARKASASVIVSRAQVCYGCPEHFTGELSGCSHCNRGAIRVAVESLVGRPPAGAENLGVCRVCGCSLPAKVQLPVEFLKDEADRLPSHCWILKELAAQQQN